jgi:hypothetical protein
MKGRIANINYSLKIAGIIKKPKPLRNISFRNQK